MLFFHCRCQDSVRHYNVTVQHDQYTFGLASFDSLQQFLEHFDKQPFVAGESGKKRNSSSFMFTKNIINSFKN